MPLRLPPSRSSIPCPSLFKPARAPKAHSLDHLQSQAGRRHAPPRMKRTRCCWRASWAWLTWDCGGALARSLLALCCAAATGCGTSEGGTPPSKIAARVNSEAISEHELEAALKRGESLERLIEQRLARQRALEQGLDRAPQIVQATE